MKKLLRLILIIITIILTSSCVFTKENFTHDISGDYVFEGNSHLTITPLGGDDYWVKSKDFSFRMVNLPLRDGTPWNRWYLMDVTSSTPTFRVHDIWELSYWNKNDLYFVINGCPNIIYTLKNE